MEQENGTKEYHIFDEMVKNIGNPPRKGNHENVVNGRQFILLLSIVSVM